MGAATLVESFDCSRTLKFLDDRGRGEQECPRCQIDPIGCGPNRVDLARVRGLTLPTSHLREVDAPSVCSFTGNREVI